MKKAVKKRQIKKHLIIGVVSVVILFLLVPILIFSSKEGVVGKAFSTAAQMFKRMPLTETAPQVFNTPFYQSPVRAEPDDLLMLPGYGFKKGAIVVYKQTTDLPASLSPPATIPVTNMAAEGQLKVVSDANLPHSLTVLLPETMKSKQPYALWVKNPTSSWSKMILINDARPLWLTPSVAYSTQKYASLPRELKVVGRNLESYIPRYGVHVKLILIGGRTSVPAAYDLITINDGNPSTAIEHYVAKVPLPSQLSPGNYKVQISRDGTNWVDVPQELEVLPDPIPKKQFKVLDYGGCKPDDGKDDTGCIVATINAAKNAGGGEVYFPAGTWELRSPKSSGDKYYFYHGIVVPPWVDLVGAGSKQSIILQTLDWKAPENGLNNVISVFTLLGDNIVRDLHLDSEGFNEPEKGYLFYLDLGKIAFDQNEPHTVKNIQIYNCKFTKMMFGTGNGGSASLRQLFIANNEFQAYNMAVLIAAVDRFDLENSVIAYNLFYPGDYVREDKLQGTIASFIGASKRVDFSNNVADGYVNNGWRAAFFFNMYNNHEMSLISQNSATCTGDKAGDGEAIVYDNHMNKPGFNELAAVTAATADTVSVNSKWNEAAPNYYTGDYAFVADGKGVGQARKIAQYTPGNPSKITVSPPWDVIPDQTSKLVVARNVWNSYIVDNLVDNRNCLKTNYQGQSGMISWWGMASDSTIEGNQQFESDGILALACFQDYTKEKGLLFPFLQYANEIRNNLIDGIYNPSKKKNGGVQLWYCSLWLKGNANGPDVISPVLSYNLAVSHNQIIKASTSNYQGAIALLPSSHVSSITPYHLKNVLIHHNNIKESPSSGIYIHESHVWNSVLYKNTFEGIEPSKQIIDKGTNTVIVN